MRIDSKRPQRCCMCDRVVILRSSTSRHPEAPEMLLPPPGAALGFVSGDHAPEMVVTCSGACLDRLLTE